MPFHSFKTLRYMMKGLDAVTLSEHALARVVSDRTGDLEGSCEPSAAFCVFALGIGEENVLWFSLQPAKFLSVRKFAQSIVFDLELLASWTFLLLLSLFLVRLCFHKSITAYST